MGVVRLAAHVILFRAHIQIKLARGVAAARFRSRHVDALVQFLGLLGRDGPALSLSVAITVPRALDTGRCGRWLHDLRGRLSAFLRCRLTQHRRALAHDLLEVLLALLSHDLAAIRTTLASDGRTARHIVHRLHSRVGLHVLLALRI